jgi:hypothetical protein
VKLDSITIRNKDRDVLRLRVFQYAISVSFGKIMLRPINIDYETFLDQNRSDELIRIRPSLLQMLKYTYVKDFASVVSICPCVYNTGKAGEEPLRKYIKSQVIYFTIMPCPVAA